MKMNGASAISQRLQATRSSARFLPFDLPPDASQAPAPVTESQPAPATRA